MTYSEPSDSDEECNQHDLNSELSDFSDDEIMKVHISPEPNRSKLTFPKLNSSATVEHPSTYVPKPKKAKNLSFQMDTISTIKKRSMKNGEAASNISLFQSR